MAVGVDMSCGLRILAVGVAVLVPRSEQHISSLSSWRVSSKFFSDYERVHILEAESKRLGMLELMTAVYIQMTEDNY